MENITGFGLKVNIVASNTYPSGVVVTEFADDADPFDIPVVQIADKAMGLNGDLIVWSKANPLVVTINVIPNSENDKDLAYLVEANWVGKCKSSTKDVISLVAVYPDGTTYTYKDGALTDAPVGTPVSSSGRFKTGAYSFAFESRSRSGGPAQ